MDGLPWPARSARSALLLLLALGAGCVRTVGPIADAGRGGDGQSPFGSGAWQLGPVTQLPATVNTSAYEGSPWLAPDGITLTFARANASDGGHLNWDLYRAVRSQWGSDFGAASPLQALTTAGSEYSLSMSADLLHAVLTADRGPVPDSPDLLIGRRPSAAVEWKAADFTRSAASTAGIDVDGLLSWDGLRVYFVASPDTVEKTLQVARRASLDADFEAAAPVSVPAGGADDSPALSPDESVLVFSSSRAGGSGGDDLWWAKRGADGTFSTPQPMPVVNSAADERETFISRDGRELFFASSRPGGAGKWDLYRVEILKGP